MIEPVRQMAQFATIPILAKPNAGLPELENGKTVTDLKRLRIEPCLENLEYELYDGSFDQPHGRTKLGTVRDSYED